MHPAIIIASSLLLIIVFGVVGGIFAQKATVTSKEKGECHQCWYQYNISVSSIMFLLGLFTLACCCVMLVYNRVDPYVDKNLGNYLPQVALGQGFQPQQFSAPKIG